MKRAFTLIELVISITLLSLIFVYLYRSIDSLRFSNIFYEKKAIELKYQEKILKLLYEDIMLSNGKITFLDKGSREYSILRIDKTKNSLYNIKNPTVIWYVSRDEILSRVESKKNITLPMKYDDIPYSFIDGILPSCKSFKLYNSNNKKNLLLYLKAEEMKPLIFEFNMI